MPKVKGDYAGGDLFSFLSDKAAYDAWLDDGNDNADMLRHLRKAAAVAIRRELTEKQREYLMLYIGDRMTMREIADLKGVNVSSVSRTIRAAKRKLFTCLRYAAPWLLNCEL